MNELLDAVRNMDPSLNWKWENLGIWYQEYFYAVVQHQYDAEEKIYFPWIRTKVEMPVDLSWSARRSALMQKIAEITELIKAGRQAASSQKMRIHTHLCEKVEEMAQNIDDQFADEEEIVPRWVAEAGFTRAERDAMTIKIIQNLSMSGQSVVLPTMVHALKLSADPEKAAAFVQSLPLHIRFLYSYSWVPDFQNRHQGLIRSVRKDEVTNPTTSFALFACAGSSLQVSKHRHRLDTKPKHTTPACHR
jgi:hypothetical protein